MEKRIKDLLFSRILTTQELSEYTGLSEEAIQKRLERGKIDAVLKGRTYLFDRRDFVPKEDASTRRTGLDDSATSEGEDQIGETYADNQGL